MRNFKFIDQQTWEIFVISAKTKTNANKEFKHLKNIEKINPSQYSIVETFNDKDKNYSSTSFSDYEAMMHRKNSRTILIQN